MVRRIYRYLCSYLSSIKKRERILATILIVFWSSFVISNFILKGSYIFEGQITALLGHNGAGMNDLAHCLNFPFTL